MQLMSNYYEKRRQRLIAGLAGAGDILDIGCAHMPNVNLQGKHIVGLDLEDMDVRPPYTEHIAGDIFEIDNLLPGRKFDTILMGEFIEHVERPYDVLRCVRNHIAPSGTLLISTPNPLGIPVVAAEYLCLRRFYFTKHHTFYFTPRWVWRLLESSGYKVVKTIGCGASICGVWLPAPVSLSYIVIYAAKPA